MSAPPLPRVILYNPRNAARPKPILPLSLLALGATLEGVADYTIVDANLEVDPLQAVDRAINESGAPILAVTVMPGPQLKEAVPHTRELKLRHPDLSIVWGGYFPTQHWDVVLRSGYVDWVVRGHGELVFRSLVEHISGGGDATSLEGVAYRTGSGAEPVSNPVAPVPHPEELPPFPYERLDLARYVRPTVLGRRTLSHHSSYGCPFFCNFCAVVNMVEGKWLAQSAERVAGTISYLADHAGIDSVEFFDNNFFVRKSRTHEFAERIRNLGIAWWGEGRIDTLLKYEHATWKLMADSGLRMIFMGAESGSDDTLRRMDKGGTMTADKTIEIAALTRRFGIIPEFSFVMGSPPEPDADVDGTIAFIKRLKKVNPYAEIVMYMYTPVPLSGELYSQAQDAGFSFPDTLEGWCDPAWEEFSQRRSTTMPWVSDALRRRVRNFERVLNAYYPTATNPRLRGVRRGALRAVSAWRWASGRYELPLELRALHRVFAYQRPETTGF
ncbi:MAG TPA: radical SAM protein [Chloroflexota bacterium]|nr:radical SAM protein [Chloroflexota bacterium]